MIDSTSQFFAILTNIGVAKQANADALGVAWKIAQMGVGDANGTDPVPSAVQTKLINEWRRAPLNQLKIDPTNSAIIIAEQVIPAEVGGKWIREIGLYDADGDLVAVANCAPSFKPLLNQGSGRTQVVRLNMQVSNSSNVELKIDPSVVLATRDYVERRLLEEIYKLDTKQSVRVATSANIVLSGLQTVDTVVLVDGDRVLVRAQTAGKENGIYVVSAAGAWARAVDADSGAKVTSALLVSVEQGATLADTRWQLITDGAIVLGTTPLVFQDVTTGFAPLMSPAFGGIPTTPTPALVTTSRQIVNAEFVQALLTAGLSQRLSLSGGQLTGLLQGRVGAAAPNNPNNCGIVFDADTGLFSPSDGVVQLVANGSVVFQNTAGGSAQFLKGVRAPKGGPGSADISGVSGYAFSDDGDTGMFAEGGTVNAGSDLVFRIDSQEAGRLKSSMKAGASSGWTRLISGKLLQWTAITVTPVAGNNVYWSANLPTGFAVNCHQAFAVLGSGSSASKVCVTTEVLGNGAIGGYMFSEDNSPRVLRIYAVGE